MTMTVPATPPTDPSEAADPDGSADGSAASADRRSIRRSPGPDRADGSGGSDGGHGGEGPGRSARLPWVLAAIGLVGTLVFAIAWLGARSDAGSASSTTEDGPTAEMLDAARSFSEALTNFDGATIDRDFDRITAKAAGSFRDQADEFFSSDVRKKLKETQASSRGEIRSAFVQTAEGDRGTVFVVVDQTIANNLSPQPQSDTLRMELGLVRRGDTWKVSRVSVLTAPSGGSTPTGGPSAGRDQGSGSDSGSGGGGSGGG